MFFRRIKARFVERERERERERDVKGKEADVLERISMSIIHHTVL